MGVDDSKVWLGGWDVPARKNVGSSNIADERMRRAEKAGKRSNEVSVDRALAEPWNWSPERLQQEFARASLAAGEPVTTREDFAAVWEKAVQWALQSRIANPKKPITPYEALEMMAREKAGAVK